MARNFRKRSFSVVTPLVVASALFMQNLDSTIIATALPTIARDMGESPVRLSFAITSYLLSLAVFIPISGWLADRFGARSVFRLAIVVFSAGSLLCGLSGSLAELVLSRVVQGVGGALMVPVGRLVVVRSVSKADLVQAMSFLTIPGLLGPLMGPPIGGFIVTHAPWQWIFFINLPIGLIGFVMASLYIENFRDEAAGKFDARGFVLAGLSLCCLIVGFEMAGRGVLPYWAVSVMAGTGLLAGLAYLRHARRVDRPVLNLALLRKPTFATSIFGGSLFRIGIGAVPVLLPLMLQVGFGLDAFSSGLISFAGAAGALTMKFTAGQILRRLGFRRVLIANAIITTVFLAGNAVFEVTTPHAVILVALLVGGFFRSLQFTAINALGYADIPPADTGAATSLSSTAQQVSLSLGVAFAAAFLDLSMSLRGVVIPEQVDFAVGWIGVALVSFTSMIYFVRLAPEAGSEVSGKRAVAPSRGGKATAREAASD